MPERFEKLAFSFHTVRLPAPSNLFRSYRPLEIKIHQSAEINIFRNRSKQELIVDVQNIFHPCLRHTSCLRATPWNLLAVEMRHDAFEVRRSQVRQWVSRILNRMLDKGRETDNERSRTSRFCAPPTYLEVPSSSVQLNVFTNTSRRNWLSGVSVNIVSIFSD